MNLLRFALVPILIAHTACVPPPWTTYGTTFFPRPVDPQCVSAVLRREPKIDSVAVAAESPLGFGTGNGRVLRVGPVASGPGLAEVDFGGANGAGAIREYDAGPQVRVTASWTWRAGKAVPSDSVRAVEARLQDYVIMIRAVCRAGQPVDTLDFRHSWETPAGE